MGIKILKKNKINENNKSMSMSQITFLSHDPFGFRGKTFKTAGVSVQLRSVSFEY